METVTGSVCWRSKVLYNFHEQYINLQIYRLSKEEKTVEAMLKILKKYMGKTKRLTGQRLIIVQVNKGHKQL